jgi:hypothetical protein
MAVLLSAATLQQAIPDAVLVGGAAAAWYAGHRDSFDHDHVLADLQDRYEEILEAVEATDGWVTSVRASSPPLTLLGSLGGIEAGLRQLRRSRPLEVASVDVAPGRSVRIPTPAEMLRIKAYLVVLRNQVRDYLDVVAMTERFGPAVAVDALAEIDQYYQDRSGDPESVLTSLVQRLSEPNPRDTRTIAELHRYKRLDPRWHAWPAIVAACEELADALVERVSSS